MLEQEHFPIMGWQHGGAQSSWAAHGSTPSFVTLPSWLFFSVQLKQLLCWHLGDDSVLLINGVITL